MVDPETLGSPEPLGREFFQRAFEDAPIGMALVGVDERIVGANVALCRMLGYSRDELLRLTVPQITHPDDLAVEVELKAEALEGGQGAFRVEKRYVRADGTVLIGRLSVSTLVDDDGAPRFFVGQLEDVTRERRAEEARRASEALFRALVENTTEVFVVVGADGDALHVSPAISDLLGWAPGDRVGLPLVDLFETDEQPACRAAFQTLVAQPDATFRRVVRMRHQDGGHRQVELVGRNLLHVPELGGVVITMRDLTREQNLQEQLTRAQRLDSIGRLAGGVAHDFNNMLGVIMGFGELLGMSIREGKPSLDDLDEIMRAAAMARDVTQKLLAVGRRQNTSPRPVDVNASINGNAVLLAKVLGPGVQMQLVLPDDVGHARVDPSQLDQIILNLATNARDAMPDGGRLVIETRRVAAEEAVALSPGLPMGSYLQLTIRDTGEGMDEETTRHIFEPFYTTKEHGRGTGLGLASVYGIVEQARGRIWVESEVGEGASFYVLLPTAESPEAASRQDRPAAFPAARQVLIVEDEEPIRRLTARILTDSGYGVRTAKNLEEGLAMAREIDVLDLVVTDVVMPGGSGVQFIELLTAERGDIEVLFMSGYAKADLLGDNAGRNFIAKPFTPAAFVAKVREILAS